MSCSQTSATSECKTLIRCLNLATEWLYQAVAKVKVVRASFRSIKDTLAKKP